MNLTNLIALRDLFPAEDYQLKMRFQRGAIADFFRPTARHDELIGQRRRWLESAPNIYAALLPQGVPLLEETIELAKALGTVEASFLSSEPGSSAWERCLDLGRSWEPDYLLLKAASDGQLYLFGGCVCFPSSWSLAEKIGQPLDFIHSVVPGLNATLGKQIDGFLAKIRPGISWERTNWGLSRSSELNQHPDRKLPRLDATVQLEEVWLRVEHQSLVALPINQGVLFGIRIAIYPLSEVKLDAAAASGLCRAVSTMPEGMAQYKNMAAARSTILALLRS